LNFYFLKTELCLKWINFKTNIVLPQPEHNGGIMGNKNPMLNDNLSRIIRWYKGRCTFEMRKINPDFKWHSRFHEHIIRNDTVYQRINDYIENNPKIWKLDTFFQNDL